MLFLTNQRVIFRATRITISHGHEWKLEEIQAIGRAKLSVWSRIGGYLRAWYLDVEDKRHYFAPWLVFHRGWLEKLEKISGLPIGEPRDLFT